jgi:hypothetical protein
MLTTGFKLFMGYCLGALLTAAVYGYTTGGNHMGPLSVGWKGAVGEHVGYAILLSTGAVAGPSAYAGGVRDADARCLSSSTSPLSVPPAPATAHPRRSAPVLRDRLVLSPAVFVAASSGRRDVQ